MIEYVTVSPVQWGEGHKWSHLSFFLFGGGEANISGSIGPKSVNYGSLSKGDEGVCNICLDSVSKQISASRYGWGGGVGEIFW